MSKRPNPEMIDDTNPEWTDKEFKRAVPFNKLSESLQSKLRGRPKAETTKERITIRLSPEVLEAFKEDGAGWQTRIDEALKQFLKASEAPKKAGKPLDKIARPPKVRRRNKRLSAAREALKAMKAIEDELEKQKGDDRKRA